MSISNNNNAVSNNNNAVSWVPSVNRKRKRVECENYNNSNALFPNKNVEENVFTQLPHEIIFRICSYLPVADVVHLESACTSFSDICHNYWNLAKYTYFNALPWKSLDGKTCGRHCCHKLEFAINKVMLQLIKLNRPDSTGKRKHLNLPEKLKSDAKPLSELIYRDFFSFKWLKKMAASDSAILTAETVFSVFNNSTNFFKYELIKNTNKLRLDFRIKDIESILSHSKITPFCARILIQAFDESYLYTDTALMDKFLDVSLTNHDDSYSDFLCRSERYIVHQKSRNEQSALLSKDVEEYIRSEKDTLNEEEAARREDDLLMRCASQNSTRIFFQKRLFCIWDIIHSHFNLSGEIQCIQTLYLVNLELVEVKRLGWGVEKMIDLKLFCEAQLNRPEFGATLLANPSTIKDILRGESLFFDKLSSRGISRGTELLIAAGEKYYQLGHTKESQECLIATMKVWSSLKDKKIKYAGIMLKNAFNLRDYANAELCLNRFIDIAYNELTRDSALRLPYDKSTLINYALDINANLKMWKKFYSLYRDMGRGTSFELVLDRCTLIENRDPQNDIVNEHNLINMLRACSYLREWKEVLSCWAKLGSAEKRDSILPLVAQAADECDNNDLKSTIVEQIYQKALAKAKDIEH